MKKGSLLLVVALLAISSLMAAMAYTSASVENDMNVTLTNTQSALLALTASPNHNAAFYGSATAKQLKIDLDKGFNNIDYGIQPDSIYTWEDLFTVTNNSENTVTVTVRTNPNSGNGTERRVDISAKAEGAWAKLHGIHSAGPGLTFTLAPGASQAIDLKTDAMNGHVQNYAMKIFVDAVVN